jgi:tRNA pseudouridine(55) synthase
MTYAGRLDPLAEGELLILTGDDCKRARDFMNLDKEYEVEIVFGIKTDSHDILGIPTRCETKKEIIIPGKYLQEYPPFSSKTVNGIPLYILKKENNLPKEMPKKEVEIYSVDVLLERKINSSDIKRIAINRIKLVKGDFRQAEIIKAWEKFLIDNKEEFGVIKLRIKCSSGTYMRKIADNMNGFAISIKRIKIFLPTF